MYDLLFKMLSKATWPIAWRFGYLLFNESIEATRFAYGVLEEMQELFFGPPGPYKDRYA